MTGDSSPAGAAARRRQFLKAWAAPAAATAVAGCSEFGGTDDPLVEDLEPGDTTGFGGAMRFGESYAMSVTAAGTGDTSLIARFDGTDRYLRYEEAGTTVESYLVGGDGYVVADGACTRYPDLDAGRRAVESVAGPEDASGPTRLAVTDRTEIDGRPMLVLEPTETEASGEPGAGAATYYVDESSRYPRRIETDTSVVDYRDWGAVAPVEPPDIDCRTPDTD